MKSLEEDLSDALKQLAEITGSLREKCEDCGEEEEKQAHKASFENVTVLPESMRSCLRELADSNEKMHLIVLYSKENDEMDCSARIFGNNGTLLSMLENALRSFMKRATLEILRAELEGDE